MPPTTIMDDEYAGLWFHPEARIVHHKIRKFLPPGVFRSLLTTGAEWLERHGAQKWLSDDRDSVVVPPEDIAWADAEWSPRVLRAGFRFWAIVTPSKAVAALQMKGLIRARRDLGVTVELFESLEDAMAWLESR
jgi:hypothetical protein